MVEESQLRRDICEAGRRLWELGLVGAREGNISARLSDNSILCTPAGASKGHLNPLELVTTDLDGSPLDGRVPSSEILIHLAAYKGRPDCKAVVHAHPPIATSFTLAGKSIPDDVLPESAYVLGPVADVPFGFPGTTELSDQLAPYLSGHKTFLLSHHGAMTLGTSVADACDRMETLERVARMLATALFLGEVRPLPSAARERLRQNVLNGRLS